MARWGVIVLLLVGALSQICTSYGSRFSLSELADFKSEARGMFYHAYNSYKEHAFPWDELRPLSCRERRWDKRERGHMDDSLGGFSLTLIDSLPSLAVLADKEEFSWAVNWVINNISFDRDVEVSVFEVTIRVLGGLLSAHQLAMDPSLKLMEDYDGGLLRLARDLGERLLPSFQTPTGIPKHRVNLKYGMIPGETNEACTAGATTLLLEFGVLSRLTGNPDFERAAGRAVKEIWSRRSQHDLVGGSIDTATGNWLNTATTIGAGIDSFYEYLLKSYILFGDNEWYEMFNSSYHAVQKHLRLGDWHVQVDMHGGKESVRAYHVSSLQAFWPGLQVLAGDILGASLTHNSLLSLWKRFDGLPELYDLHSKEIIDWAKVYPLRPELLESTYHLYEATKDDFYVEVAVDMMKTIISTSKVQCGYAAVQDVLTRKLEDRMDSFFLSETVKYLYLIFHSALEHLEHQQSLSTSLWPLSSRDAFTGLNSDTLRHPNTSRSPLSRLVSKAVFTTEGHILLPSAIPRGSDWLHGNTSQAMPSPEQELKRQCLHADGRVQKQHRGISASRKQYKRPEGPKRTKAKGRKGKIGPAKVHIAIMPPKNDFIHKVFMDDGGRPSYDFSQRQRRMLERVTTEGINSAFGPQFSEGREELSGVLAIVGRPSRRSALACDKVTEDLNGTIALVQRGHCTFVMKARNVQEAGGIGLIVADNGEGDFEEGSVLQDDGSGHDISIPTTMIPYNSARMLRKRLQRSALAVHISIWSKPFKSRPESTKPAQLQLGAIASVGSFLASLQNFLNAAESSSKESLVAEGKPTETAVVNPL